VLRIVLALRRRGTLSIYAFLTLAVETTKTGDVTPTAVFLISLEVSALAIAQRGQIGALARCLGTARASAVDTGRTGSTLILTRAAIVYIASSVGALAVADVRLACRAAPTGEASDKVTVRVGTGFAARTAVDRV